MREAYLGDSWLEHAAAGVCAVCWASLCSTDATSRKLNHEHFYSVMIDVIEAIDLGLLPIQATPRSGVRLSKWSFLRRENDSF